MRLLGMLGDVWRLSDFERKVKCLFEFYNTFRTHVEQKRNMLRMKKNGGFQETFSPSDKVELDHLEKLINESNELFPYVIPLQDFEKEILENNRRTKWLS